LATTAGQVSFKSIMTCRIAMPFAPRIMYEIQ
jgi:hypothetical protein